MRQHQAIDLMWLRANVHAKAWIQFVDLCKRTHDVQKLTTTLYGMQAGMADLAKQKLNTEEINVWYIRLTRHLEKGIKQVLREQTPMPGDTALGKAKSGSLVHDPKWRQEKKKRDNDLEKFLRGKMY